VAELVAEAVVAGVERIVTIGTGRVSSERAVGMAEAHPEVMAAIGVHPHDADGWTAADAGWILELAAHPKVVAIGECGLDYYRDHAARDAQRRAFSAQIGLARDTGLPVVVHTREAEADTIRILAAEAGGHPVVLHCFSMPARAQEVAQRGWYASFAGQVTYPNARDLQEAARSWPQERLLVETDSPYLAPVPRRGRPNRPANVAHTVRFLARLRGQTTEVTGALTTANAGRLFGFPPG
jgi:TatD DNase family protein